MNNEEKILVLLEQHSEMFAQINSRLDKMDERLNRMEEYAEITRDGVNALLDWAEACSGTQKTVCLHSYSLHEADKLRERRHERGSLCNGDGATGASHI